MSAPEATNRWSPRWSPWPHVWAWVLCCATFPLLWIGGLITTTDAGMAVPDWPGTYGYNLWLYPWSTWFFGPWDLFIEHGHRLLASGVGLITIGFTVVVWRCDPRGWMRSLAITALALVIFQGVLGGVRVWANERLLAMAHGSTGPVFFALTAALVILTRRPNYKEPVQEESPANSRWVWLLPALVCVQLVLGAAMRHAPEDGSFVTFAQHVQTHLIQAGLVTAAVGFTAYRAWRSPTSSHSKLLPSLMVLVLLVQLSLGVATWVAKYRLPRWANTAVASASSEGAAWAGTLRPVTMTSSTAGGWGETHTVTAHSANGSLLLALATAHAVAARHRKPSTQQPTHPPAPEAAA